MQERARRMNRARRSYLWGKDTAGFLTLVPVPWLLVTRRHTDPRREHARKKVTQLSDSLI